MELVDPSDVSKWIEDEEFSPDAVEHRYRRDYSDYPDENPAFQVNRHVTMLEYDCEIRIRRVEIRREI